MQDLQMLIFFWAENSMYFGFFFWVDHMYCLREFCPLFVKGGDCKYFLLANSLVGQNSGSIELYFLIYFRMDCSCLAGRAEVEKRRKKRKERANPRGPIDRCLCPVNRRSDTPQCPIDRSHCPIDWMARVKWERVHSSCDFVSF